MAYGEGFGKVILFGEHFVVSGNHAIVCGINSKTTAIVEAIEGENYELVDKRPETPGYKQEKFEQQKESLQYIFKAMQINPKETPIRITLTGDLLAASGVGASAASCAAIARALNEHFKKGLNNDQINEVAFQGELGYHGKPSGIDNTAATFGGLLWYQRGNPPTFEKMKSAGPVEIVMGNTGVVGDTKKLVLGVQERKEKEPAKYNPLFEEAEQIALKAKEAFANGNIEELGTLMNRNHELLQEIGVSHPKLEELIAIARENGAIGAKMTGGGGGGYMIALTPGAALQEKVAKAMQEKGFTTVQTTVG
ncbi:mevalonate kinase [Candidatus Micrarchaeota archaeon]|nr:mevalonate kinase [Candidatus Micrarchaeota archaeon]MBU1930116.1 mevalonate kinase [Candidatus Micrarchaeota archaeon]